MSWKIVERQNPLAVHGIFETKQRAQRFIRETIPVYVARSYFTDKTLTAHDFIVMPEEGRD